jgi:hypothetical protein
MPLHPALALMNEPRIALIKHVGAGQTQGERPVSASANRGNQNQSKPQKHFAGPPRKTLQWPALLPS